jgi:23S rRNA pseudouridine1911/1915/1917 synthase
MWYNAGMNNRIYVEQKVPQEWAQHRLDQVLAALCPQYSRSQIQHWIRDGFVQVDNHVASKPRASVASGQKIVIETELTPQENWEAQEIPLKIIYADEDILVIDKPAGLVVHPGAGNPENTLVNALVHYDSQLATVPRAGIVHRLDKETSGLLVVARNLSAHHYLVQSLQRREVKREYVAVVYGIIRTGGVIKTLLGRHPTQRTKMSVVKHGKPAVTHYRILEIFREQTLVHVELETGRTHQIRVHFAHIQHPLVGDPVYGRGKGAGALKFHRQALHALQLTLSHPRTGKILSWSSPLPDDIRELLEKLRQEN